MAYTVTQVVTAVRQVFPDIADADIVDKINEANQVITQKTKIYPETTVDINLVAGTREYVLSATIQKVWAAAYVTSAGESGYQPLIETSQDELDIDNRTWRAQQNGVPYRYYELGGYVGLYPTPNTTTSGGYPILRLFVNTQTTLTSISSLPSQVPTLEPWKWYACKEIALEKYPDRVGLYDKMWRDSMQDLVRFVHGRLPRQNPRVKAQVPYVRNI